MTSENHGAWQMSLVHTITIWSRANCYEEGEVPCNEKFSRMSVSDYD